MKEPRAYTDFKFNCIYCKHLNKVDAILFVGKYAELPCAACGKISKVSD